MDSSQKHTVLGKVRITFPFKGNVSAIVNVVGGNSPHVQEPSFMNSSHEKHLTTVAGNPNETDQLEDTCTPEWTEDILDGPGHEHGACYVDSVSTSSTSESDVENNRKLLTPKNNEDLVRHVVTSSQRDHQDLIECQQEMVQQLEAENKQLKVELGRLQFLECKEKRKKRIQTSMADGAERDNLLGGAGPLQEPSKLTLYMYIYINSYRLFIIYKSKGILVPICCKDLRQ